MHPKNISIKDFTYSLPDEKIALFPLQQRDTSKLLIFKDNEIGEDVYANIAAHLPEKTLLIFNDTKVIQARIFFQKATGGVIEIFCLEPYEAISEYATVMNKKGSVKWKCLIGGVSKWKSGPLQKLITIGNEKVELNVTLTETIPDAYVVEFSWLPASYTFAEVLLHSGEIPLPPYIKRKASAADKDTYQTIFALNDGSVAAPTAGLHFTEAVLSALKEKKIGTDYVTLHVGAGTFKPVKAQRMEEHEMHAEWIEVNIGTIKNMLANISNGIVATGTTSLRTIESIYWMGVKTKLDPSLLPEDLHIKQWDVYNAPLAESNVSAADALSSLIGWMERNNTEKIFARTQILISPGYRFRIINALITNFHQPQSTLLLLVAAIAGDDWKRIYEYALQNNFRFLSYGDGSLLFLDKNK